STGRLRSRVELAGIPPVATPRCSGAGAPLRPGRPDGRPMMRRSLLSLLVLLALSPAAANAQWTVDPGGWFMSHGFNVGRFPDRFSATPGATRNALEKVDWGMYAIYGLRDGLSIGMGQGFARLEQTWGGE